MFLSAFQFFSGLLILAAGSEFLVRSSSSLAKLLKKKVFFISLFLLGAGTSAPELFVTLQSHLNQESEMALANIIGSNIFNILIVSALIILTHVKLTNTKAVLTAAALLLATTLLAGGFLFDLSLSWWNGLALLGLFSLFFIDSSSMEQPSSSAKTYSFFITGVMLLSGFFLLFLGAQITISSAVNIGELLGFSKRIVGLFLLSVGTSLPELAVAAAALIKRKSEMALGGVVGSNAFNTLFIPGIASLFSAFPVSLKIIKIDVSVMLLSEVLLLIFLFFIRKISVIFMSSLFILGYLFYAVFVLLDRV